MNLINNTHDNMTSLNTYCEMTCSKALISSTHSALVRVVRGGIRVNGKKLKYVAPNLTCTQPVNTFLIS